MSDPFEGPSLAYRVKPINRQTSIGELQALADEFVATLAKLLVESRHEEVLVRFDAYRSNYVSS